MLEVLVHTSGLPPPRSHGYIWIDLPKGLTIEVASGNAIRGWRTSRLISRGYGDDWVRSGRSCVLFVPSAVIPAPYFNVLINPSHPQAGQVRSLKNPKALRWGPRLY